MRDGGRMVRRRVVHLAGVSAAAVLAGAPAVAQQADLPALEDLEPGVSLRVYQAERGLDRVAEPVDGVSPNLDELRKVIDFPAAGGFGAEDHFIATVTGYLLVDEGGEYGFRLTSDDGSMLLIDGERVIWNRGLHPATALDGVASLSPGLHALKILFFENEGEEHLSLRWRAPGADDFELVPDTALRTEKGVTRVTSPGTKPISAEVEGLRPGDGVPLEAVHPGWRAETIHPDSFQPMVGCLALLPDGRLLVGTFEPKNNGVVLSEPNGTIWALSNLDASDRNEIVVEKFADGFYHPLGMCVVNGDLYIAQRDEITRMRDADADGVYETRERFASGWTSDNYHHFTFGFGHHDGFLYATLSASIGVGQDEIFSGTMRGINGPAPAHRGTLMKIALDTGEIEYVCGGLRAPNAVLATPDGRVLVGDNQGAWMPASKVNVMLPGHFYGHYNETRVKTTRYPEGGVPSLYSDQPLTPPALWLPQNECANSPTAFLLIPHGPFAGQLYIGELKMGGIRRAFLEEVNGVTQGAVFRFTQGLEAGVNRLLWGPGGEIYVGCIGERDTWSWRGTRTGLQRLVPVRGAGTFEYHSIAATPEGFEIRFTRPADREQLHDPATYQIRQWRYVPTPDYGGPKVDEEALAVTETRVSASGLSARLTVPGLKPGRCVFIRTDVKSATGEPIWSPDAWYTLNEIPGQERPAPYARPDDGKLDVLVFSGTAGFRHDSIEAGIACVKKLGQEHGFTVQATEDAGVFNDEDLSRFDEVVFLNTTGDVLDLSQEAAFERFIRAGRGYVGVHAAADTEYDWAWYGGLVGAYFESHPAVQEAVVRAADESAGSTGAPAPWRRTDEWYNYRSAPDDDVDVLLWLDESTYEGGTMGASHPIAWRHAYDGGRAFYTGCGHTKESYSEEAFVAHLLEGIRWAAGARDVE